MRRAAAAAALRRERNNSNHSDEISLKRHRPDNGILGNNNSPDVANHMSQITPTDFSTNTKHSNNNNNTPPIKDNERERGNFFFFLISIFKKITKISPECRQCE